MGLVYLKLWTSANEIVLTQRTKETLQNFLIYSESVFSTQSVDSLHLLRYTYNTSNFMYALIPDEINTQLWNMIQISICLAMYIRQEKLT